MSDKLWKYELAFEFGSPCISVWYRLRLQYMENMRGHLSLDLPVLVYGTDYVYNT